MLPSHKLLSLLTGVLSSSIKIVFILLISCLPTDVLGSNDNAIVDKCNDCKLASDSINDLIKLPRQMDAYGQMDDRVDLEKIKKRICKDIINDENRERCRHFYFTQLSTIQKWKNLNIKSSFFDYVCIKELKLCCPRQSYGPKCNKCVDCNVNEHCHGEGTRQGNGTCVCKEGHSGPHCMSCQKGFHQEKLSVGSEKFEQKATELLMKKVLCKACHKSCLYCRHGGPLGCEVCQKGFTWIPDHGCSDIDECTQSNNKICGQNTFCVNTEGSYFCYECDRACDGCYGDGPDMCLKCKPGYKLDKGNCVALRKTIIPPEANYYRYAIYTGLLTCAGIVMHNNVYMASLIGLAVAMYITYSEYIMSSHLQEMQAPT